MGIRRTKKEKLIAEARRIVQTDMKYKFADTKVTKSETKKEAEVKPYYYQPEITLPLRTIKLDLTKTIGITILALILQLALYTYLQHGGWTIVLKILKI